MKNKEILSLAIAVAWAAFGYGQVARSDKAPLRNIIATFADARNAHKGPAVAALYSEDGKWLASTGGLAVRGRTALATLWGGLDGQVRRIVHSIDFAGPDIAIARVDTQYAEPIGLHHESSVFVREGGRWLIRVHQTVD